VPRISEFFGIAIYMYWFDQQKHKTPPIHARFAGEEAVFDLSGRCLEGDIGGRAARLVDEWCRERSSELRAAWDATAAGQEVPWVAPLR
jgi:hypothetical protein